MVLSHQLVLQTPPLGHRRRQIPWYILPQHIAAVVGGDVGGESGLLAAHPYTALSFACSRYLNAADRMDREMGWTEMMGWTERMGWMGAIR